MTSLILENFKKELYHYYPSMKKLNNLRFDYVGDDKGNPVFKMSSDDLPLGLTSVIQRFAKLYQIEIV